MVLCMALAAAVLTSCRNDSRVAVCQYANISNGAWDRPDRITFPVDSISTNGNYRLTISLRTTNEVQFQTIYLTAEQHFTHPEHHSTDTVAVALTDETGKIQGKGLGLYNYSVALATTTPAPGTERRNHRRPHHAAQPAGRYHQRRHKTYA